MSGPIVERKEEPNLFGKRAIAADSVALERETDDLSAAEPTWLERLQRDPRLVLGLIVGLFVCLFAFLASALRKGPGGGGMTHT